jgi:hypothetical protein
MSWISEVINELKHYFGLPKTVKGLKFEKFDPESYSEYVKRYFYFWDFFGVYGTMANLRCFDGVIYSVNESKREDFHNISTITPTRSRMTFDGKYYEYRQEMTNILLMTMSGLEYRQRLRNELTKTIQRVDREQFWYVTYVNNRIMDLFNII